MKSNKSKAFLVVGIFVLLAAILLVAYTQLKPEPVKGSKQITVEIIVPDEDSKEVTLRTDAEYLRQALEEVNLIKGDESEYGLMITEVDGRKVDPSKNEWWMITKDGEMTEYGVDTQVIVDGDHFELTLSTY